MTSPAESQPGDGEPVRLDGRRRGRVDPATADDARAAKPAEADARASDESIVATPTAAPPRPRGVRDNWRIAAAGLLLACGVAFVLLGWYGAAHTNILTEQIPYLISGGLLGLGLIVVAGIFAASAAGEAETRALRREIAAAMARSPGVAENPGIQHAGLVRLYAVSGGRSYHFAGCPIIEGKNGVRELTPPQAASEGLSACKLCAVD